MKNFLKAKPYKPVEGTDGILTMSELLMYAVCVKAMIRLSGSKLRVILAETIGS